jgi:hypothetical protein
MVKQQLLVVSLSLAACLCVLASGQSFVGQMAPDFTIEQWTNGTGKNLLSEFRGRVVLIEFWSRG